MNGIYRTLQRSLAKVVPLVVRRKRGDILRSIELRRCRNRFTLPMETLFTGVSIETRTDCTLKCPFCPQSTKPRAKLVMTDDVFKHVIDDLANLRFSGRICPLTNNEPLLDDRIVDFIAYARHKCPLSFLELISNGTLLDEKLFLELFAAGLDNLILNDYRNDRHEYPHRLSKNHSRIAELSERMMRNKVVFNLRSFNEQLGTRAGNIHGTATTVVPKQFCALPFTRMWIQPEGKAILCCEDYSYGEIMGDVKTDSLSDIWYGEKYCRIRSELYRGDRMHKICAQCEYSGLPLADAKVMI